MRRGGEQHDLLWVLLGSPAFLEPPLPRYSVRLSCLWQTEEKTDSQKKSCVSTTFSLPNELMASFFISSSSCRVYRDEM